MADDAGGRRRIVYVDMDGTLVDFATGVARTRPWSSTCRRTATCAAPAITTDLNPTEGDDRRC